MIVFCRERHQILQTEIHWSIEPVKPQNFPGKTRILLISKIQGPFTAPSQMKGNQKSEFQAFPPVHLIKPLYIVENSRKTGISNIYSLKALNPVPPRMNKIIQSEIWTIPSK